MKRSRLSHSGRKKFQRLSKMVAGVSYSVTEYTKNRDEALAFFGNRIKSDKRFKNAVPIATAKDKRGFVVVTFVKLKS